MESRKFKVFASVLFLVVFFAATAQAQNCVVRDDFNRADSTNMGANWTELSGDFSISGNRAVGVNGSEMSFNGNTTGDRACVDFYSGGNMVKVGRILLKYTSSSDNLRVSLQDSDNDAMFDRIYFERDGGFSFNAACNTFLLSSPFTNGRLTAYLDGTTLKGDIDTDFNGTVDQSYQCTGAPQKSGTKTALNTFGQVQFDNFATPLNTLTVTKTADTNDGVCDADCSLREAIVAANAGLTDDLINFAIPPTDTGCAGDVCTVALGGTQLTINSAATAGSVIISNTNGTAANLFVSGNNASRVFNVGGGANATLSGLTITGGSVGSDLGGGISNSGTLTLINTAVSNNTSNINGGGIQNNSSGVLTLINSTVSNNSANTSGGGINNGAGNLTLINSTVSNNSAGINNGGIAATGTINLINSTVSTNRTNGSVGGITIFGTLNARNSIISGNFGSFFPNLSGSFSINDSNIVDNEGAVRLAPLGFYGGATMTHALLSGSTAINAGNNCVLWQTCPTFNAPVVLTADQRGASRVGNVDIGAFELNNSTNGGTFVAELPRGTTGVPYNYTLVPNNGAFTYSQTGGSLPTGINLTTSLAPNAVVAVGGTAAMGGIYNFEVTATDGANTNVTNYRVQFVAPVAAGVSIGGRVMASDGRGIRNAIVTLTLQNGETIQTRTGTFGYYRFDDIEAGQTVTMSVASKRFTFAAQIVTANENLSDVDFTAIE